MAPWTIDIIRNVPYYIYIIMHGQSERCGEVPGAVISMLLRGEYPDDFTKEWRRLTSGGAAETNNSQMAF